MVVTPRLDALAIAIAYVGLVATISAFAIHYEGVLDGLAVDLPPLTRWMLEAHSYTPLLLALSIPAILCAFSATLSEAQRQAFIAGSLFGLILVAIWAVLVWLAMGLIVYKLDQVVA